MPEPDTYGCGPAITVIQVMTAVLPCACRYDCTRAIDAVQALQVTGTHLRNAAGLS
jgi:hypothetical protein